MEQTSIDMTPAADDDALSLALYAERAYLDYAVSVVKGRALPDVCDGQKPVQRRILFAMHEMGLRANAKPMKSARVVGDVLGKYHPHGDQAAYEAMVRMAQNFTLRYPLIDGQGNFGSRDGDGAAAMRYTEARLTPIARLLLDEIDMGTVEFMSTYDGTMHEPRQLPARLPIVLLNGASGIAVGMATEICPHNLREVAQATALLIQKPDTTLDAILPLLPGPDFPGGAHIISGPAVLRELYDSGRGSLKVRARWTIEELARGQWQLVVHELPPNVSSARILEEIEDLTNPKVKTGKKNLSPEQQNLKQATLALLDAVRDESGRDAAVRLVFEPKSRNVEVTEFVAALLTHTSLETNVSVNLVSVAMDGRPGQRGLLAILHDWVAFRVQTVRRRCEHRLTLVDDRLHVLAGRLIAWLNIDEVIRIIREADDPGPALMRAFGLSERQAEDILEIRLRQLARLEKIKIEQEIAALDAEKADLLALLGDEDKMRRRIVAEIKKDAAAYGDDRRTLIEEDKPTQLGVKIVDEPVTVIVSEKFWVKTRQGHGHALTVENTQTGFKAGDRLYGAFECRTTDVILAFGGASAAGRVFSVPVSVLPSGRGDGAPLPSLIDLPRGGVVAYALAADAKQSLLIAGERGYGFLTQVSDLQTRQKTGKQFLTLDENEKPLPPMLIDGGHDRIAVLSSDGRLNVFPLVDVKTLSGGRGVQLMALEPEHRLLVASGLSSRQSISLSGPGRGGKVQSVILTPADLQAFQARRGHKGKSLLKEKALKFTPQLLSSIDKKP